MKNILWVLIFLLPLHAFVITVIKCKYWVDTNILRFWKELILIVLLVFVFFKTYAKSNWSLKKIYKNNTLLGVTTLFIFSSAAYIYLPFFEIKTASVLGFKYDVFFFLAMIIGLYCGLVWEIRYFLKLLFLSTFGILIVFLPWYIFGDISSLAENFGYSSEVSTYTANSCISFAQNVEWQHRFQGTFWGPIRFSVFLTIVWSLFAGWILSSTRFDIRKKYLLAGVFYALILPAIFFSYSKTSMLGALFAVWVFSALTYKYIYNRKITAKFYIALWTLCTVPLALVALVKWELFLHLWAMVHRLQSLSTSLEMFFYNPFGYGLWIAWPASQLGSSIESAGSWQIATSSVLSIHTFLPENWYVQILLEQWLIGFSLFMALMMIIGLRLLHLVKTQRNYLNIWITTAYFSLCLMALFTHSFEESATSYILFFLIGLVLATSIAKEQSKK